MDGREYNCQKVTTNGQQSTTEKMGINSGALMDKQFLRHCCFRHITDVTHPFTSYERGKKDRI